MVHRPSHNCPIITRYLTTIETGIIKCLPIPVTCHELGVNIGEAVPQFSLALDLLESSPNSLSYTGFFIQSNEETGIYTRFVLFGQVFLNTLMSPLLIASARTLPLSETTVSSCETNYHLPCQYIGCPD